MTWLDSITNSINKNLSKLQEKVEDRGLKYSIPRQIDWAKK